MQTSFALVCILYDAYFLCVIRTVASGKIHLLFFRFDVNEITYFLQY